MADYDSWPLWVRREGVSRNVNPDELALSLQLQTRLNQWQKQFDRTLNRDDPASSGFASDSELRAFEDEGKALFGLLKKELRGAFQIEYFGQKTRTTQTDDHE
jgi:hypothetical protein